MNRMASNITKETFLYFGFGSNLLRQRIKLMNPSAVFKTTAKLKVICFLIIKYVNMY